MDENQVIKPVGIIKKKPGLLDNQIVKDIVDTIILPVAKNIIAAVVERILFGESRQSSDRSTSGRISYRNQFQERSRTERQYLNVSSQIPKLDDLVFSSENDALSVINLMYDRIEQYGYATVSDLYEIVGLTSNDFTDNNFGWNNQQLSRYDLRPLPMGGIHLRLPSPRPINR